MAIAYVADRAAVTFASHTGTITFSLASNATSGNSLTLCFTASSGSPGQIATVTDTKGNTWTIHVSAQALGIHNAIAQTPQNAGALTTGDVISITVSVPAATNNFGILVQEWSGMITTVGSGALDTSSNGSTPGSSLNLNAGSAATTNASDLSLLAYQAQTTGRTFTQDAAWTVPTTNTQTLTTAEQFVAYRILSATGTYGPGGTLSAGSTPFIAGAQVFLKAQPGPVPTINVSPVISGTTVVGNALSTTDGTWTNSPTSFAYRWQRDAFGNGVYSNITSATANTYTLVDADDGCNIRCNVTASNANGPSTAAPSNSLGLITEPAPVNSVSPALTGSPVNGQTLSCSTGTWTGMGGHGPAFTRQWQSAADALFTAGISNLGTATTQAVGSGEVGLWIRCTVTATNDAGAVSKASNIVGPVTSAPVNTVAPVIAGTTVVGQTLSTTDGTWDFSPTSFSYQWQRDVFGNSVYSNIAGSTANTRVLTDSDDGCHLRCRVTATNTSGSATATSNVLGVVTEPSPVNLSAPSITGVPAQGQVLGCSTGSWSGMAGHSPSFTYQWQRDVFGFGAYSNIGSATSSTYTLVSADRSCHVQCVVTAHNSGGTATSTGASLRVVYVGTLVDMYPGAPIGVTAISVNQIALIAVPTVPNLCTNGSFENSTTGWVSGANMASFTVVTGGEFDTHRARLVTAASAGNRYIRFPVTRTSTANSLVVTFWAIADATTPAVNLDISIFNLVQGGATLITDQQWTKVTLFASAADLGATLSGSAFLRNDPDGSAVNTFYIDGVKIEESSVPTPQLLTPILHTLTLTDAHLG